MNIAVDALVANATGDNTLAAYVATGGIVPPDLTVTKDIAKIDVSNYAQTNAAAAIMRKREKLITRGNNCPDIIKLTVGMHHHAVYIADISCSPAPLPEHRRRHGAQPKGRYRCAYFEF